jgi:hypothetical protein
MRFALGLLVAVLALGGCGEGDKPKTTAATATASGNGPSMDPNIDKAVKSVAGKSSSSAGMSDGPPPNGVFAPGEADQKVPPGAPVKVELIDKGAEPRVALQPVLQLAAPTTLRIAVQRPVNEQAMLTIDYTLAVFVGAEPGADGGKGKTAPAATGAPSATASAEPAPPPTGPQPVFFVIKSAEMLRDPKGPRPSEDLDKLLATLKGARVKATMMPSGALAGISTELPKGTAAELGDLALALGEALEVFFSPMPSEPVGVGAYWIASDRTATTGMNVVRYRVTRIQALQGDEVACTVEVRLYAVDATELPPIQGDQQLVLAGLDAQGKAELTRKTSGVLPTSGQMQMKIVMQIAPAGNAQVQPQAIQLVSGAKLLQPKAPEPEPKKKP